MKLFFAGCIFFFAAAAFAYDFSATEVLNHNGVTSSGKIYVSGGKMRMESGGKVLITRSDKKVAYMLVPAKKAYTEQSFVSGGMLMEKDPDESSRKIIGKEAVGDKMTTKYIVEYKQESGKETVYQWIGEDTGIPLKISAETGSWTIEYKDVVPGKQPSVLFEVPSDYKKITE